MAKKPEKESIEKQSFKRGNINFDMLKSHGLVHVEKQTRSYQKKSKRGMFDKQTRTRKKKWISPEKGRLWLFLSLLSVSCLVLVLTAGKSVLWLALIPVLLVVFLWSMAMVVLLKARPH